MSLLDLYPTPSSLILAGRRFRVPELRIVDLVRLERWMSRVSPLEIPGEVPEEIADDPTSLQRHWARCYLASRDWPPAWGSVSGESLMATLEGTTEFLFTLLRRHNEEFDRECALALAEALTDPEWHALYNKAYGAKPSEVYLRLMDPDSCMGDAVAPGERVSWTQAVCEVLETYSGLNLKTVGQLTLSQFRALRSGGKDAKRSLKGKRGQSVRDAARARKRLLTEAQAEGWRGPTRNGNANGVHAPCPS